MLDVSHNTLCCVPLTLGFPLIQSAASFHDMITIMFKSLLKSMDIDSFLFILPYLDIKVCSTVVPCPTSYRRQTTMTEALHFDFDIIRSPFSRAKKKENSYRASIRTS